MKEAKGKTGYPNGYPVQYIDSGFTRFHQKMFPLENVGSGLGPTARQYVTASPGFRRIRSPVPRGQAMLDPTLLMMTGAVLAGRRRKELGTLQYSTICHFPVRTDKFVILSKA